MPSIEQIILIQLCVFGLIQLLIWGKFFYELCVIEG
jgi:hypothetical protein